VERAALIPAFSRREKEKMRRGLRWSGCSTTKAARGMRAACVLCVLVGC
jgi:hypothetical protein